MEAQLVNSDLLKQGWLTKEAVGKTGNWRKRYFVFRNNGLYYYEDKPTKPNQKPKGMFELNSRSVIRPSAVQKPYAFEVVSKPILLRVHADNQMEANQWQAVLKEAVEQLKQAELVRGGVREPKMEGFLIKRAMTSGRNWKKRWFVLKGGRISYFEERPNPNANDKPKGVMELTPDTVVLVFPDSQSSKPNTFEVTAKKIVLTVSADTKECMLEWVQALDEQILIKAGIVTEGAKEVSRWLRLIGLNEYSRRFIDLGYDELATVWDMDAATVKQLPKDLDMSRLETDYFVEGMAVLKKGKKPKSFKEKKEKPKPKLEVVNFPNLPPGMSAAMRMYTWGDNEHSQLGLVAARTGATVHTPTYVDSLKGKNEPRFVACGASAMATITGTDAALYTHGTGPLGLGADKLTESRPHLCLGLRDVKVRMVAVGVSHMAACSVEGEGFSWGGGDKGQLGLGAAVKGTGSPQPIKLPPKTKVVHVAVGEEHTLLCSSEGKVFACGGCRDGKLGLPTSGDVFEPTQVRGLDDHVISQVACGDAFSLALAKAGASAYWWGAVAPGKQLVVPTKMDRFTSRPISTVAACGKMGMFLAGLQRDEATGEYQSNASVFSWGADAKVLGHGDGVAYDRPTLVEGLEQQGVVQICPGLTHAGVLTNDGRVLLWGNDDCGQLGSSYLVPIARPSEAIRISGFRYTFLAVGEAFTAAVAVEDPSFKLKDEAPGTPLPPPPPPEEVLVKADHEADELQRVLDQFAIFSHKYDLDQMGGPPPPPPDDEPDIPPPPPPQTTTTQRVVGGKRILGPGSRDMGNGWIEHKDVNTGRFFYENASTGMTQWVAPGED